MKSLVLLAGMQLSRIYPAHGDVVDDAKGKVLEYIQHRQQREEQIITILKEKAASPREIVEILYRGYPESLFPAAENNVKLHLDKLEHEQVVKRQGNAYSIIS
jgi:ribonuclease/clavin/mitogillin